MIMGMLKRWRDAREQLKAEEWKSDEPADEAARAEGYKDLLHQKASVKKQQKGRGARLGDVSRQDPGGSWRAPRS
jgi:hypothetical protein